jgi:predicted DNA-binding transcriptional regulator YafY
MKSNRMFGILCRLLETEKITAKELAEYFEVSVRTIHRDLLDLSSAGFPVVTQQGIGGGIFLLDNFRYNKTALNKDEMNLILAGLNSFTTIDDSAKIKILLAKLHLNNDNKMLLENDIVIDFTTWNYNSTLIKKIKSLRKAIATKTLVEIQYYSGTGYSERMVEPYKLIFKQEYWYLFGFCRKHNDFRIYKLSRIVEINLTDIHFEERQDYEIPELKSDFVNSSGQFVTVRMDISYEFFAIDFFGIENIHKDDSGNIFVTFQTEDIDWAISVFSQFGEKAEIISPDYARDRIKDFLKQAIKQYET